MIINVKLNFFNSKLDNSLEIFNYSLSETKTEGTMKQQNLTLVIAKNQDFEAFSIREINKIVLKNIIARTPKDPQGRHKIIIKTGHTSKSFKDIEKGFYIPGPGFLYLFATAVGCSIENLYEGVHELTKKTMLDYAEGK